MMLRGKIRVIMKFEKTSSKMCWRGKKNEHGFEFFDWIEKAYEITDLVKNECIFKNK